MPAAASADISSVTTTSYGAVPTTSPAAGAYDDYTIIQTYNYGNGTEPKPGSEDLKKWVVDSPAGLAGNPNSVPEAQRCTPAQFDPTGTLGTGAGDTSTFVAGSCPASSIVGHATVYLATDATSGAVPGGTGLTPLQGTIYILKTTPEVPTTLATQFNSAIYQVVPSVCASPPCPVYPKTRSILAPVTTGADGDFRLRTIPQDDTYNPYSPPGGFFPTSSGFAAGFTPAHIYRIDQHLFGQTNGGAPFVHYPTRCTTWNSYSYVTGTGANTNADSNPDPAHPNAYKKSAADVVSPSCANPPTLQATATSTLSTTARDSNPSLTSVISNPSASNPTSDIPKSTTVTLPASITTDLQSPALLPGNLCEPDQAAALACPAAAKVGTASIETPFIVAGLTGDVYAVRNSVPGRVVPDLLINVAGSSNAINFSLTGHSTFVGPNGNQIQTTFDNLPQSPFTKFTVTINGGKDSLLTVSKCPDNGSSPQDGPITYSMHGYAPGETYNSSTPVKFGGCYGAPTVKSFKKCLKFKIKFTPGNQIDTANISKMELYVGSSKKKVTTRYTKDSVAPFKFNKRLSHKFKSRHRYYFLVKVTYKPTVDAPKGKVLKSKVASFKRC